MVARQSNITIRTSLIAQKLLNKNQIEQWPSAIKPIAQFDN